MTTRLSCTVIEIRGLKDNGVTHLTFGGHVTSSAYPYTLPRTKPKMDPKRCSFAKSVRTKGHWTKGHQTKGHLFTKTYLTKLCNRFVVQFFVELIYV